jgi:aminoglycoside phosphotransferase (APT) family kinase protein
MSELLTVVDEPTVKAVLAQEVPGLIVQAIAFHHAYQNRCIVEVNHSLILKFPLREEMQKRMEREHWMLSALYGKTSVALPTPLFTAQQVFCYGYKKVPGILLTDEHYHTLTVLQKQSFAQEIALFLSELHRLLDVDEATAAGLEPPGDPLSAHHLRQRLIPFLQQSQQLAAVERLLERYEQLEQTPEQPVVLHGDLHGWNIALDYASNQLAGVFDLNGACIGDPHLDLRYFFYVDPFLLENIVACYQRVSTRKLSLIRGILYAAATDLSDLVYSMEEQRPLIEGPLSDRIDHLQRQLRAYDLP